MQVEERDILVLGPLGMLGQMVVKYFNHIGCNVIPFTERFTSKTKWDFIDYVSKFNDSVVINCIGKIPQKGENENDMLWANTILPLELANHLQPNQVLIHPSTDCVFDGNTRSKYHDFAEANARDAYGWTKRLGELALAGRKNTLVFRVSIIGPNSSPNPKGLLSWFRSNPSGSKLNGYVNYYWNGITTLEWCKQVHTYLQNTQGISNESRLIQLGTRDKMSKYDLLLLFQDVYETRFDISEFALEQDIDRRLVPTIACKPILEQLRELKEFEAKYFFVPA